MKKKRTAVMIGFLCLLGGVELYSTYHSRQVKEEIEDAHLQIGLSVDSFIIERWQRERDIFVSTAKELGAEVNVQNANGDIKEQIAQLEYLISKKVDTIVVIPIDAEAVTEVIKKARREGVKVISYDRLIKNANVDLYISFDNKKVGELMAQSLIGKIGVSGDILMVCGPLTDYNVVQLNEGFENKIARTHINTIDKLYTDEWLPEKAFDATTQKLQMITTLDGIMCGNDGVAGQVIKALAEKRLAGKVYVVGQDADLEACQRIVEGTQTMTVYKPVNELAKQAAEYAVRLGKGEALELENAFFDGEYEVPYKQLEPIAVTKENMDEVIIKGGFHLKEDVYLNIPVS